MGAQIASTFLLFFAIPESIMAWRPSEWVLEGELDNTQLEMNYFMFQIGDALTDISPEDDDPEPPSC